VNFFTEADLNVQNLPNPNITGDFQATEAWPFKELSDDALTRDIDLMYCQGPYPIGNGQGQNCSGMNAIRFEMEMNWPQDARRHYELCARSIIW
jgi:hypothetical protein